MNIFFIYDKKYVDSFFHLYKKLKLYCEDISKIDNPNNDATFNSWIKGVLKALRMSGKNDILIFWFDFQAILCWWIAKLFFQKRKIICINVMLKNKPTLKNRLIAFMYKQALADGELYASVTSAEYGKALNKRLKINKRYKLIHDVFYESLKNRFEIKECITERSVFCGGRNGRDWDIMMQVAKQMPGVTFNFVMPKKKYDHYVDSFTANMNVLYEISESEFEDLMRKSCLVCLPLNTDAPAGLIVMFQAAANKKLVITSDTQTTREYIDEQRGVLLKKNVQDYVNVINYYLEHTEIAKEKTYNLYDFLEKFCGEDEFIKRIVSLINTIIYENVD